MHSSSSTAKRNADGSRLFLSREPVIDRRERLVGYSLRVGQVLDAAESRPPVPGGDVDRLACALDEDVGHFSPLEAPAELSAEVLALAARADATP